MARVTRFLCRLTDEKSAECEIYVSEIEAFSNIMQMK